MAMEQGSRKMTESEQNSDGIMKGKGKEGKQENGLNAIWVPLLIRPV